jgi:hypothetical protein
MRAPRGSPRKSCARSEVLTPTGKLKPKCLANAAASACSLKATSATLSPDTSGESCSNTPETLWQCGHSVEMNASSTTLPRQLDSVCAPIFNSGAGLGTGACAHSATLASNPIRPLLTLALLSKKAAAREPPRLHKATAQLAAVDQRPALPWHVATGISVGPVLSLASGGFFIAAIASTRQPNNLSRIHFKLPLRFVCPTDVSQRRTTCICK